MEDQKALTGLPPWKHIISFIAIFSGWLAFQLGGVALRDGSILGIYGLFVFTALAHTLYRSLAPTSAAASGTDNLCMILYALPLIVLTRYLHIEYISHDYSKYLSVWYRYIQTHGLAAYADSFTNYTPLYTYLLAIPALLAPAANSLLTIKLISFAGELLAALFIYLIAGIKYGQRSPVPLLAALVFLLLPTVIINSAFVAQCDVWYTACLLGCVYYAARRGPFVCMIFFAVAFAFKLQTILLCPFMLILVLNRKMPWHYFAVVPVIYILSCLPSWLEGRSWLDLSAIYVVQTGTGMMLSHHAPNLYAIFPKHFKFKGLVKWGGVALTGILMAIFSFRNKDTLRARPEVESYVFLAFASVALTAFFLPKMHDRYFYTADVFSLLVAVLMPRFWFLPVCYQLISGLSLYKFADLHYFLSHHLYLFISAIVLNVIVSAWLYRTAILRSFLFQREMLSLKSQDYSASRNTGAAERQLPGQSLA